MTRVDASTRRERLQHVACLLTLATFLDDALRVATDYAGQARTLRTLGVAARLVPAARAVVYGVLPAAFVAVQLLGVALVLAQWRPQTGCVVLIVWTLVHPFIYQQQGNLEFVCQSLTIAGGALILLSSERSTALRKRYVEGFTDISALGATPAELKASAAHERSRLLLLGRVLLTSVLMYHAAKLGSDELGQLLRSPAVLGSSLAALAYSVLLLLLLLMLALIVTGINSRQVAALAAAVVACAAIVRYPWFVTIFSRERYKLKYARGYEEVLVDAWLYADHQRYFFFQQLSTAGALLQLVCHGPGSLSMDATECEPVPGLRLN